MNQPITRPTTRARAEVRPGTVTVMLGGPSAEREISLRSGAAVVAALRSLGHTVHELDPAKPGWVLPRQTEVVFLTLHGTYGEDGTVQEQLESLGALYTGCGVEASRLAFDKVLTKKKCLAAGVPTPRFAIIDRPGSPWPAGWQPPVVLKPVRQGSSVGLQFVERTEDWTRALEAAFAYDREVLLEERIAGKELTVGILAGGALPLVEVRPKGGAYDYKSKYTTGATDYFCPAPLPPEVAARVQSAGLAAFNAIGGRDYGRVDVMLSGAGEPLVLEVNTLPGMTETSLLPKAAAAAGISFPELCQRIIDLAQTRQRAAPAPAG